MKPLTRWTLALGAALLFAHAAAQQPAQQPVDGTEVVVTDAGGHQLVGYGVVKNGLLMLRMGSTAESFVLVMLAPDGSVKSYQGIRGAGGALIVDLPDGTRERLSSLLSRNDVALRVVSKGDASHTARARSTGGTTAGAGSGSGSGDSGISVDTGDTSSGSSGSSDGSSGDGSSNDSTDGH